MSQPGWRRRWYARLDMVLRRVRSICPQLALTFVGALMACTGHVEPEPSVDSPTAAPAQATVQRATRAPIVTFEAREFRVTVHALDGSPTGERRFSVVRRDGSFRELELTAEAFSARYPELARQYETAFAAGVNERAPADGWIDAGL